VRLGKFDQAVDYLTKGECLEPTNPNFPLEMAFALAHSERYQEALALYDQIVEIGPFVSAHDIAVGRRGRGFVLVEMGDLENAEASYKQSFEFEPGNKVAQNELLYIEQLRKLKSDSHRGSSHR
jgi:Flp pilus assembly protein TadD